MFERNKSFLALLLAGLCILGGSAVLATDGEDPPIECGLELCLEITHECADAVASAPRS